MNYVTVSARVPRETKRQADQRLREIDATTSQLIVSAFEYVIKHGKLPESDETQTKPGHRALSPEKIEELNEFLREATVNAPAAIAQALTERTHPGGGCR